MHSLLKPFFDNHAPACRTLFVLHHAGFEPDVERIRDSLIANISPLVSELGS
jgi:hypothetical protein